MLFCILNNLKKMLQKTYQITDYWKKRPTSAITKRPEILCCRAKSKKKINNLKVTKINFETVHNNLYNNTLTLNNAACQPKVRRLATQLDSV